MKKQLIITAGLAILMILILSAALVAVGIDISKRANQIGEIKKKIDFRSNIIKSLSILRSDINTIQPYIFGLDNILLARDQLINFSRELSAMAAQNKITIASSFSGEDSKTAGELRWIGLTATVEGGFNDLINFLKVIENSRYSIKLDNIDLNEKTGGGFKALFNGKVFYF